MQFLTRKLTEKQATVLRFVITYNKREGQGPSIREIAGMLGRDQSSARRHIELLMNKGMLKRELGRIRTLHATPLGHQEIMLVDRL